MRPRTSWSDLRGCRVGVWGAGVEGGAAIRRLRALGVEPVVVDDAPTRREVEGVVVVAAARGGLEALRECEYVVKSPGISRHRPEVADLEARGVAVVGGLGLWLEDVDRSRVVCVTGTKGKSTTVSIAGALAEGLGARCFVGGNLGRPPFDPDAPTDVDYWIIEVSSFQAADLTCSPPVVGVTSLHPDHLDWHGDAVTYYADKLSACSRPGADLTVANGDDPLVVAHADRLGPRIEWVHLPEHPPAWVGELGLLGRHNARNALLARACLVALGVPGAGDARRLAAAAVGFRGLESRLQVVGTVDGVDFVDDSLSTNVLPTTAALAAFEDRPVAVLVGGFDRGIDYAPLAACVAASTRPRLVLTLPDNGDRIAEALRRAPLPATAGVVSCADVGDAVARAFAWCRTRDGVVLLSPAAPSFGRFLDYRDRAAAFAAAMRACAQPPPA